MKMPSDPNMLLSIVNMKLRDNEYTSPAELAADLGWDISEMDQRLKNAGFEYLPEARQYR